MAYWGFAGNKYYLLMTVLNIANQNAKTMNLNEKAECLKLFAQLVDSETTGNAITFASKLSISRSCLYGILDEVKDMGVELTYDRHKESYCYSNDKMLAVCIPIKIVDINSNASECPYKKLLRDSYKLQNRKKQ